MSDLNDMLTDKNGEQSKSKKTIVVALIVGVIILVLVMVFRNAAANASSGGTSTGSAGSGTTTTGTTPTDTTSLGYQQGLADIQNAQATLQEQLQEQLLKAQTSNSESLATFNSNLQQTNTMNAINDLVYSEQKQFTESQSETSQSIASSTSLLTNWFNTLAGPLNGKLVGTREVATTNAIESQIFGTPFSTTGSTSSSGTPSTGANTPLNSFWQNFKFSNPQATGG